MSNVDHLLITDNSQTLTLSNSNPKLELQNDLCNFFETISQSYKLTPIEKFYKIFDDINVVSVNKKIIELQITLKQTNNFVIVNKIKLTNQIEQCLKDCYITSNGKIIVKHSEFNQKIINLTDEKYKAENVVNCSTDICLHLFFKNKSLNALINNVICVSYVNVSLKNRIKYISSISESVDVEENECAMMF